jgi:poly-gamma-glutamate synthesis protein (capsule biosynthesis protein)
MKAELGTVRIRSEATMAETVRIALVGDIFVERPEPEEAIAPAAPILRGYDIRFGNLEAPLSDRGTLKRFHPWANLRGRPHNVRVLPAGGFQIVSLANNHAMDYGPDALVDTIEGLEAAGIQYVGAGRDEARAWAMQAVKAKGLSVGFLAVEMTEWTWIEADPGPGRPGLARITVSAFYPPPHVDRYQLRHLLDLVRQSSRAVDLLVVSVHWGISVGHQIATYQQAVGRKLVEAGARIVVGHHPHTLQGVELYRGGVIAHSLGNFLFDSLALPPDAALLACDLRERRVVRVALRPTRLDDRRAVHILPATHPWAAPVTNVLSRLCADLGTRCHVEAEDLVLSARRGPAAQARR